jgi:hypothetical protein
MEAFLDIIAAFPTVVYTVLLAVVVAYWGLVIAGLLDLDILDISGDHGHGSADGPHSPFEALGLAGIPVTVVGSVWLLVAWVVSVVGAQLFAGPDASFLWKALLFVSASLSGLGASMVVLRPFRGAFALNHAKERRHLVGKVCVVVSGRVDERFGTGRIDDGGDRFEVHVRCREKNALQSGSQALVIDYDERAEAYIVVPAEEVLPGGFETEK